MWWELVARSPVRSLVHFGRSLGHENSVLSEFFFRASTGPILDSQEGRFPC